MSSEYRLSGGELMGIVHDPEPIYAPAAAASMAAELLQLRALRATIADLADQWADQPTDYDEDTEQQIHDGWVLRTALTFDVAQLMDTDPDQLTQRGIQACTAARNAHLDSIDDTYLTEETK